MDITDRIHPEKSGVIGIDSRETATNDQQTPYNQVSFEQIGVLQAWEKYGNQLTWGKGQTLAIIDDGCDLTVPEWQVKLPWGNKVIATWNSIDHNDDPTPVPPGYHGTTVGYPSSMNYQGVYGIAYNNSVIHIRGVTVVHLTNDESKTMADALRWVLDHREKYNISAVNLSPLDDERHQEPVLTCIDDVLKELRQQNIWVSGPCGNHHYTDGISWPACQPYCYGIGGTKQGAHDVHLDRFSNTDLLVCAQATSSSNAYAASSFMVMKEAIEKTNYQWQKLADNLPDAVMKLFQQTGIEIFDSETNITFKELNLLNALDAVFKI